MNKKLVKFDVGVVLVGEFEALLVKLLLRGKDAERVSPIFIGQFLKSCEPEKGLDSIGSLE